MRTIWKYTLEKQVQHLDIPKDSKFLHVGNQNEEICLWFEVETENEVVRRRFEVAGTGNSQMDLDKIYLGTALFEDGSYVWHVYELANYVGEDLDRD